MTFSRASVLAGSAAALLATGAFARADVTLGGRIWLADYRVSTGAESGDLGMRPFLGVQFQTPIRDTPLAAVAAAAHGEGWDLRTSRFDLMLGGMYQHGMFSAGAAWHGVGFGQKDAGYRAFEHGPEALAGVAVPVGSLFSVRLAGTLLPVLLVSDNDGESGVSYGYTWDVGGGAKLGVWALGIGYRANYVADNAITKAQEFRGPYTMAAYAW